MAKINILDSSIFNLISAGEVVDKPMSVVKELVENSIDAGANEIEVEVRNGGIDFIRVTDNGCGIEKGEIQKAFMPHATSKIKNVEDLNSILTLGFRGEALASIAAVARVTLTSRIEGEELGKAVIYDSGKLVSEYECGCPKGTTVTVENIFEKIPARQKYLRAASSEEADISNLITRLILSNPNISFKYFAGNKKTISTGEGEKSALVAVYGNEILNNMEEISLVMPDITIRGFVGKPSFSKHSRNYQTLVVNGRYVKNEDISYMVYLCYKDFLMSRQFPSFVLYIDLPADMVDVNVHPSKMDVKFVQPDKIKKHIKALINAKLNKIALSPKTIEATIAQEPQRQEPRFDNFSVTKDYTFSNARKELREPRESTQSKSTSSYNWLDNVSESRQEAGRQSEFKTTLSSNNAVKSSLFKDTPEVNAFTASADDFLGEEEILTVGTLFSTYIIVEQGDDCYLIDQHAAHERMLYDKLVKQIEQGKPAVQSLLLPYTLDLSDEEGDLIERNLSLFRECGFEIYKDGQKFLISAVPAIVSGMKISEFFPIFFDAVKLNELSKATLIKDVLAQSACKAAVKGDRLLSLNEISYLIKGINTLDALLCPHGRPIAVKLTKTEIDKWFKRK